jgi:bifunctional DNA-binding transcriptional regulator/antitoxin component of YhaV-PrlF toxin-antitoxin module
MSQIAPITTKVDAEGQLVVPADVLRAAGMVGCVEVSADVEKGRVILTTVDFDDDDDSWADTPEVRAAIEESIRDGAEGRVYRMSRSDLERFVAANQ